MALILIIAATALATVLVQIFLFSLLHLGDLINHPWLYLGGVGIGFLLWCFSADSV